MVRCPSCGFQHAGENEVPAPGVEVVPAQELRPASVDAVQPEVITYVRCPLAGCGKQFTDPVEYAAHRERNCQDPAPEVPHVPETEWIVDSRTGETEGTSAP